MNDHETNNCQGLPQTHLQQPKSKSTAKEIWDNVGDAYAMIRLDYSKQRKEDLFDGLVNDLTDYSVTFQLSDEHQVCQRPSAIGVSPNNNTAPDFFQLQNFMLWCLMRQIVTEPIQEGPSVKKHKRKDGSQYFKDKALLMEAKEKEMYTHKVKLDLENKVRQEQALVIQRNKRNAELVQENDLLKSTLSGKEKSMLFYNLKSQASKPTTPATPFVHKSRPPSQVLASLQKVNAVFPQFEGIIKERTTQKPDYVSEWCYDYAKQFVEQQLVPFYDHFKKHIQAANDTFFKECIDTSSASNAIFEINKLRQQLQGNAAIIREFRCSVNIMKVLNVGSTEGEYSLTYCVTEKLSALTAGNNQLKAQVTGKTSSGPSTSETPKVLAPGMYNLGSKYIPPPKRANWVKPTPLPKKKQDVKPNIWSSKPVPKRALTIIVPKGSLVVQIVLWYLDSGCSRHMTGDRARLINFVEKFIGTVRFGNDEYAAIVGYGDYKLGDTIISRVYYVEGLKHNLFSVGQFCDGGLEVAFRQHSCHIRNYDMVDLLKASSTKSWLWHRRLNHLNFGTLNELARKNLVRGLPMLKYDKDHLCPSCQLGKSKKASHPLKTENTNTEVLYTLHMDLCGPMRTESINGKKYVLVIVDDYTRFGWVRFLRSKDETPHAIEKTLDGWFESVGISHETSVPRSPQQNDVVERRNRTLMEAARTMLIFAKAPLEEAESPIFRVFGSLCILLHDFDDVGKLKAKSRDRIGRLFKQVQARSSTNDFCANTIQNSTYCFTSQGRAVPALVKDPETTIVSLLKETGSDLFQWFDDDENGNGSPSTTVILEGTPTVTESLLPYQTPLPDTSDSDVETLFR
ncbi:retrovirus-related pol polyprotein from transposon TNT 1-94 [Tanacetum coccineum]